MRSDKPSPHKPQCAKGSGARAITEGEYHSAHAINAVVPRITPKPIAWGTYPFTSAPNNASTSEENTQETYFLISEYHTMDPTQRPDPRTLIPALATLHKTSVSPTGKFGFSVRTALGKFTRSIAWESSWTRYFTSLLRDVIAYDNAANAAWPAYDRACKQVMEGVIPKILGALERGGRSVRPVLVHGDLWESNVGVVVSPHNPQPRSNSTPHPPIRPRFLLRPPRI